MARIARGSAPINGVGTHPVSEAIERQRLPRSASDMAKGYFEKLRGPEPDKKQP